MWDKKAGTKVIQYREFPRTENLRYDLDDYIPELQDIPFVNTGTAQVNGVSCQVWEKSKKIDPIMNIYVKVQLFVAADSNLPLKVVFLDGYNQKIEMLFANWHKAATTGNQAPGGGNRLFLPPFGEFETPDIQLEQPASETGQPQRTNIILTIGDAYMSVNGNRVEIDPGRGTVPLISQGRTILPIRAVVEALGGSIGWRADEKKVTITGMGTVIEMWIRKRLIRLFFSLGQRIPIPMSGGRHW